MLANKDICHHFYLFSFLSFGNSRSPRPRRPPVRPRPARLALPADDDSTAASNNTTMTDITQFQLNMWTGVGLALLGFLAIYATLNMDVQPDSLLYAKFITDTSGGGLKTD